jgi:hypothetical protein
MYDKVSMEIYFLGLVWVRNIILYQELNAVVKASHYSAYFNYSPQLKTPKIKD